MTSPISISTAPSNKLIGKPFYDLPGTIEVMERLWQESILDGFEFQNTAECDAENPPRDEGDRRRAYWMDSAKYTIGQITKLLQETGLPILSVHANRDVCILLCSNEPQDVARGKRLVHESLSLAGKVGADVCVFHLWDTWKEDFDPAFLRDVLGEIAPQYPGIKASVENIPTHLPGLTPFELLKEYEWITLDWRWAAMYDEWEKFESLADRIANVHLHGAVEGKWWVLDPAWPLSGRCDFYEALDTMRNRWRYSGLLTVEHIPRNSKWQDFIAAIASLRITAHPPAGSDILAVEKQYLFNNCEHVRQVTCKPPSRRRLLAQILK